MKDKEYSVKLTEKGSEWVLTPVKGTHITKAEPEVMRELIKLYSQTTLNKVKAKMLYAITTEGIRARLFNYTKTLDNTYAYYTQGYYFLISGMGNLLAVSALRYEDNEVSFTWLGNASTLRDAQAFIEEILLEAQA